MIQAGLLCSTCKHQCGDYQNVEIECPVCDGEGCDYCRDGQIGLNECPHKSIGRSNISDFIQTFDLFEKGLPPIAGGTLDQSKQFLNAAAIYRREKNRIEAETT